MNFISLVVIISLLIALAGTYIAAKSTPDYLYEIDDFNEFITALKGAK